MCVLSGTFIFFSLLVVLSRKKRLKSSHWNVNSLRILHGLSISDVASFYITSSSSHVSSWGKSTIIYGILLRKGPSSLVGYFFFSLSSWQIVKYTQMQRNVECVKKENGKAKKTQECKGMKKKIDEKIGSLNNHSHSQANKIKKKRRVKQQFGRGHVLVMHVHGYLMIRRWTKETRGGRW